MFWRQPVIGIFLCFIMIGANVGINMYISYKYDLKIGFMNYNNYNLLLGIISKPWTKLQNVAFGMLLAYIYMQVIEYRKIQ